MPSVSVEAKPTHHLINLMTAFSSATGMILAYAFKFLFYSIYY